MVICGLLAAVGGLLGFARCTVNDPYSLTNKINDVRRARCLISNGGHLLVYPVVIVYSNIANYFPLTTLPRGRCH